jgi:hypothetical protein
MADEKPHLPFYKEESMVTHDKQTTDKLFQEFKRVDPNDINNTTKIKLSHIGSNGSVEDLLKVISQLKKAAAKMGWGNGAKKFDNFELLLDGQMLHRWARIVGVMNRNNDNFQLCLYELIKYKAPKNDAFAIQQEHLRTVSKRRLLKDWKI